MGPFSKLKRKLQSKNARQQKREDYSLYETQSLRRFYTQTPSHLSEGAKAYRMCLTLSRHAGEDWENPGKFIYPPEVI